MLSWKIRLLILLLAVTPLPTLTLIGYETWAQYQLPPNLLIQKGLNKLFPGQTDSPVFASREAIDTLPAAYNLWGANANRQPNPSQQNGRRIPVNSVVALRRAIATAVPGDQIELLPGSYLIENNKISITNAGIKSAPIRVMAKQLGLAKLKLETTAGFWVNAPYWEFENLDIEGVCASDSQCEHAFHIVGRADHTTLQNNRIYNFNAPIKGNGIGAGNARYFPDDVLIQGNSFFNTRIRNTANPVTLVDVVGGDRWTLRQNLIADFSKGSGDQISYGAFLKGNGSDGLIEQNLVVCEMELPADQGVRIGLSLGGGGSGDAACQNTSCETEHRNGVIRNNIIMDCSKDVGIYLNRASNTMVAHNTLSNTLGIDVRFESSSANIINNLLNGRILAREAGTYSAQHNLLTQKTLFNRQTLERWLSSSASTDLPGELQSLLTAKALPVKSISSDFCGNRRIKNSPDIGALEFDQASACSSYSPAPHTLPPHQKVALDTPKQFNPAKRNPIPAGIEKGIKVNITDLMKVGAANNAQTPAEVNLLISANDGSARLFASSMNGQVYIIKNGSLVAPPFLDIARSRAPYFYWEGTERGLTSFTFHPDFSKQGTPGFRKFYTAHSENPKGVEDNLSTPVFASPTGKTHHYSIVTEWQTFVNNPDAIDPSSRREVLRIAQPLRDHNLGMIAFNPNSNSGSADYGLLYLAVGDGGNTVLPGEQSETDKNRMGQDTSTVFGSILRINPLSDNTQPGYQIPQNNPFVNKPGYAPEIWAYGFRNPQHFSWDSAGDGQMLIADIGQTQIEEINLGIAGANYGWSEREGTFATNHHNQNELFELPELDRLSKYTYPVAQYDHDEGLAVTGGYVYRGRAIPELYGKYVFGDIHNGRIFYIDIDHIQERKQARIFELQLIYQGMELQLLDIMHLKRADLRFGIDDQHEIYVLTKQDGMIRKLIP